MNTLSTIRTTNRVLGALAPRFTADMARRLMMTPHAHRPRPWELPALRSAEPITLRFGLAGLRWGTRGPVVLMQHGWAGRPTQFAHLIPPLLAAGRQVIALEAPAHGRSPGAESHVFEFAQAILEAAAEIKGIEAVVGHSMGGSALLYALAQQQFAERAVVIGSPASLARVLERYADAIALPDAAKRAFFALVDARVGFPASLLDAQVFGPRLDLPGLVVHDRDDDSVPFAEGEALARHWRAARFLATHGLGHRRVLGDPGVVAAVTDFVAPSDRGRRAA
jgi:pimeloyl-ACP methyl ester carboxylesterase